MRAYTGTRSLLIAFSIYLTACLTFGVSPALAADGLATDESVPQWANHQFVHFMPPKSTGITPNFAGTHGEELRYWGGTVQTEPELYLLFWGNNFWNGTEPRGLDTELHLFYESLASEIHFPYTQGWQGTLTQYTNVEGRYKDARIVGESSVVAPGGAPKNVNHEVVEAEVSEWIREIKQNGKTLTANSQFVVLTAPQSTFTEYDGCGYHSVITYEGVQYSYTLVPYPGDLQKHYKEIGKTCDYLEESSKVKEVGAQYMFSDTGVASHEFAESVTDPGLNGKLAWAGEEDNDETEIADLCANEAEPVQELPEKEGRLGWTYVYMLWDDEGGNKCKLEDPPYPTPSSPSVGAEAATGLGYHKATLNGTVNPSGPEAHYHFEWGLNNVSENSTAEGSAGYGENTNHENAGLTGLKAGTTYHFRISAANWVGSSASNELTFTTPIPPPTVTNESPTKIGDTSATLNGSVNPNGFATTYQFQYWQAGKASEVTDLPVSPESIGSGGSSVKVSQKVLSLIPFTEYKWRIVASNAGGTTDGPESSVAVGPFLELQSTPSMAGDEISLNSVACPSTSNCLAVGSWNKEKAVLEGNDYSQLWNGHEWIIENVPTPNESDGFWLQAIACSSTTACTAIIDPSVLGNSSASTHAVRWNGAEWSTIVQNMPMPTSGSRYELKGVSCPSSTLCIAVGTYIAESGNHVPMVERWNGTEWKNETTPTLAHEEGELYSVSCSSTTACTAVGGQYLGESKSGTLVATWNGTSWTIQSSLNPAGSVGAVLRGVSCTNASSCFTVGEWTSGEGNGSKTIAERWNGTEWKIQNTPNPTEGNYLWSVNCTSASACSAVGHGETVVENVSKNTTLEERWNGTIWTVRATPEIAGEDIESIHAMACASLDMCIAVGSAGPSHPQPWVAAIAGPVASSEVATGIGSTSATLNGTVNPEGWETTYHFEYGKTTAYGTSVPIPDGPLNSESVAEHLSRTISGLQPETTYHYRIVAANAAGVSYGSDKMLTTAATNAPPVYITSFGSEGTGNGQFKRPTGLSLDSSGHLWVDDSENCRVQELSEAGSYLGLFGGSCGLFYEEWESGSKALTVDNKGHIYMLVEVVGTQVQERSEAGVIVHRYAPGEWGTVYDFAIDSHGDVFVVSSQHNNIWEYSETGEKIRTFGTAGSGAGQLESPYGITIGSGGKIWVTDPKLNKLVEFNEKGEYSREVGTAGTGNGQFNGPTTIAADSRGDVWVADSGNHRVQELNEKGEYMTKFGAQGNGPGQFEEIGGLTIGSKGAIYLTDTTDNRVEKWE